jgi:hypothetical protein
MHQKHDLGWSNEEADTFRAALKMGASFEEAARLLCRDVQDVWRKAEELNFHQRAPDALVENE